MAIIHQNIRALRQSLDVNQQKFGDLFDLSRPAVGAYEEERAEPKIDLLVRMAKHFHVSLDDLLTKDLDLDPQKTQNKLLLVQNSDYVHYIKAFGDPQYLSSLTELKLPFLDSRIAFRAFEHMGNEMNFNNSGIFYGDVVLGIKTTPDKLQNRLIYTVVCPQRILTRRLLHSDKAVLTFGTENPNFPNFTIEASQILEIWGIEQRLGQVF